MTVQEVYEAAISMLPEQPADNPELQNYILLWINLLLQEALPTENSIRQFEGERELAAAPVMRNMSEELPYHDAIVRAALPYGMAAFAFIDDDNDYRSNMMRTRFVTALNEAAKARTGEIENHYP